MACFRLAPRRLPDGTVDHRWCADQYVSGALRRKAREEAFALVSALRWALAPSAAETTGDARDHA
ncbi:MAG: hypothetical protein D6776_07025 [Planctomycetota bacterium]|nr:MAG: hypothetical protein D6776_07025 [Planctomycetota bacterium]